MRQTASPSAALDEAPSRVEILGMQQRARCGYCHTPRGSRCFAMQAQRLTCADYQELIDRGWRRSGRLLYLTDHSDSCCAYYTIRTHALRHELRASERKLLRRWRQARLLAPTAAPGAPLEDQVQAAGGRLRVRLEPAAFSEEKFRVFERYQRAVHNDTDATPSGFRRFLCDSPLVFAQPPGDAYDAGPPRAADTALPHGLGSYHQCYYIDGRLAAVGVLDVLHTCVSSVYLFYDPDFRELSLGTFSALHEIALVRTLRRQVSRQIEYYYMGYFIPSCPKMAYKAQWRPAELLDMVTLGWVPIDRCLERIREHPAFCTFDPRIDSRNLVRDCPQDVLDHAPVLDPATLGEREREAAMHLEFCIGLDALARVPATRLVGLSADLERAVLQTCASLGLGLARRMELCL